MASSQSTSTSASASLVNKRLQDILISHECSLSNLNLSSIAIAKANSHTNQQRNQSEQTGGKSSAIPSSSSSNQQTRSQKQEKQKQQSQQPQSLAQAALYRSASSQPPFQQLHEHHEVIADLNLNPPERVSPQDLLIHDKSSSSPRNDDGAGIGIGIGISMGIGMGMDMGMGIDGKSGHVSASIDVSSLTLKTITVLSTLCDEAHELHSIGKYKLIPKIHLFAHDLKHSLVENHDSDNHKNKQQKQQQHGQQQQQQQGQHGQQNEPSIVLDENILAERDSKLLFRMSKFITTLQSSQNFVLRCHRLIRNILCQIHGCLSPIIIHDDNCSSASSGGGVPSSVHLHEFENEEEEAKTSNISVPLFIGKKKTTKKKTKSNNTTKSHDNKIAYPPLFRKSIHLITLGEAITKLLSVLITLDTIIGHNSELHEAWDLYKSIVTERAEKLEEKLAAATATAASLSGMTLSDESTLNGDNDEEYRSDLTRLERMIMQIDFTLLSSRSFLICIEQNFDPRGRFCFVPQHQHDAKGKTNRNKGSSSIGSAKPLYEHVKIILTALYERYCRVISTSKEATEREDIVGIYGLYCLYRRLVPSNKVPDDKLHRALCTVFPSLYPIIPLFGNVPFMPIDFITKYAPLDTGRGMRGRTRAPQQDEIINDAKELLEKQDKTFCKKVSLVYDEGLAWLLQAETDLAPLERTNNTMLFEDTNTQQNMMLTPSDQENNHAMNIVQHKTDTVLSGIMIARRATLLLKNYIFLHTFLHVPMTSRHIHAIEQLCSIAKSIEKTLKVSRRSSIIAFHKAALKMLASSLYSCFDKLRSYIDQRSVDHGKESADHVHISTISSSLWALESILKGTSAFSPSRRYAIEVAIHACSQESFQCISNEGRVSIENLLNQLKLLSDIDDNMVEASDCSFLYFSKEVYPVLMKYLYSKTQYLEAERMQLIMSAFSDANKMLRSASYFDSSFYSKQYREFVIEKVFNQEFLQPLCFEIETSLRLLLFAKNVDEMKPVNPRNQKLGHFRKYVDMPPLQVCNVTIYTKRVIQRYLERSFYNFSTVGLRDSKTYAEMAILGQEIYGLSLIENNLPAENLQGVDFTEILNIHEFAKKYNYNMVQQNFVERKSNDGCKYLKTLGIETFHNSFRRHGLGISKNLIHEVQTYLYKNFERLSEIFSNNLFRSLLSKESRWFEQANSDQNATYSYDRAMTLRSEMSKISEKDGDPNISFLEQCRECITIIGNALGLARLIRSGKMYTMNQCKKYFSSILSQDDQPVGGDVEDDFLHTFVDSLKKKRDDDMLKDVVGVDESESYLQNFYILFPALSLNWLDTSIRGKDMLNKKFQTFDAYYTDDGFAMGSAFILEVLNQSASLDKLSWFESCCVAFAKNRKQLLENLKKEIQTNATVIKKDKSSLLFGSKQTHAGDGKSADNVDNELSRLRVTAKRQETRKQEMELLHYSVLGARVFFTCPTT